MEVLRAADQVQSAREGYNGGIKLPYPGSANFGLTLSTYEGNLSRAEELLQPLHAWMKAQPPSMGVQIGTITGSSTDKPKNGGWGVPGAPEGTVLGF
jgi:hypothetical protein